MTVKLSVFVDGSFIGNKDLSLQIGFVMVLVIEIENNGKSFLIENILHCTSIKCKRVTRSILASELYGLVSAIDIGIVVKTTLEKFLIT